MSRSQTLSVLLISCGVFSMAYAAPPAAAPAGTTGLCKDGSYSSAPKKQGACRGHQGVKEWYTAGDSAKAAPSAPTTATVAAPAPATTSASVAGTGGTGATAPTSTGSRKKPAAFTPAATAAPGGGPGMVWVNSSSKVYHCQDDKWYGKTKSGSYMSEADAKAKGFKAERGKACS